MVATSLTFDEYQWRKFRLQSRRKKKTAVERIRKFIERELKKG